MEKDSPQKEIENRELIERAKKGDGAAFGELYKTYRNRIFAIHLRMVKDHASAEDLTQESFFQLFKKLGSFRSESEFSSWLHRLAINVSLMYLRRKRARIPENFSLDELIKDTDMNREISQIDLRLQGGADRVTLQKILADMPAGYRKMFVLHDVLGLQHNEIAEMLLCTVGNSKSQLKRAREYIRKRLSRTSAVKKKATTKKKSTT